MSDLDRGSVYDPHRIDEADPIAAAAEPIEAPCDAGAIRQVVAVAEGDRVELWHEARLVLHVDRATMSGIRH